MKASLYVSDYKGCRYFRMSALLTRTSDALTLLDYLPNFLSGIRQRLQQHHIKGVTFVLL